MVMFDLPVGTKRQRKEASAFRNRLLDDGYIMLQFSVYVRACVTYEKVKKHTNRLETIIPHGGNVRAFFLTDAQWEKAVNVIGKDYIHRNQSAEVTMPTQMEFWE